MKEGRITVSDGRTVAFADYGTANQTPVVWFHGGPGSRWEPELFADAATGAGLRLIGIDRPGYGRSTSRPGRTIADVIPDALAVLDHLKIDRFVSVGVSTGGAYALALASRTSRTMAAVACCAITDMQWREGRAMVPRPLAVWEAPDRNGALAVTAAQFGENGSHVVSTAADTFSDAAVASDAALLASDICQRNLRESFAHGLDGLADDRIADGVGWITFDVNAIRCPVIVLHGTSDNLVPVAHAQHTAAIVPGAMLRIFDGKGHLSVVAEMAGAVREMLASIQKPRPASAA